MFFGLCRFKEGNVKLLGIPRYTLPLVTNSDVKYSGAWPAIHWNVKVASR